MNTLSVALSTATIAFAGAAVAQEKKVDTKAVIKPIAATPVFARTQKRDYRKADLKR